VFTGNPGHLKAFDYTGPHRYFLTFCTYSRQHVFVTRERVDLVLLQIERSANRLWQRYGFERVLRDDEATLVVAKYILENPLRAGGRL